MLESLRNNIFTYKKLSESEQQSRGILGRLAGVIADTKNPTRNGRTYSSELWEHVFNDPVMQEKITNRCCFGEVGHPVDGREEVDPEKIAICLAEVPKLGDDGKLYGVFDILNTPCGKILKALCDYGTNIGVSSRGSGDIMANDEVDPETYSCECWDAVIVPAVKAARPQYVTESLNTKKTLKQTLFESYNQSSEEDKKIMKETLEDLDIDLDDEFKEDEENKEDVEEVKEVENEEEAEVEEEETEAENSEESTVQSIIDTLQEISEIDGASKIEVADIVIGDKSYPVSDWGFFTTTDDPGKIYIDISCDEKGAIDIDGEEDEKTPDEKEEDEPKDESEEAIDDGSEETFESLKAAIRKCDLLEQQIKALKNEKTVSDAEVNKLREDLNKYKTAFNRTSEVAATAKKYEAEVTQLTEQLNIQNTELNKLKNEQTQKLNENLENSAKRINQLKENIKTLKTEASNEQQKLSEELDAVNKKLTDKNNLIKKYQTKCNEAVNRYISYRASILGVRTSDITKKLSENFSFEEVDNVCDKILNEGYSKEVLPFGVNKTAKVKLNTQETMPKEIDDTFDDLLVLAGLKD